MIGDLRGLEARLQEITEVFRVAVLIRYCCINVQSFSPSKHGCG